MFWSTSEIGKTKSKSKVLMMFAIMPTMTVRAVFSKSVSCISIGRNSTLQPISESAVGGFLNLREFQLVDYKFSKCELPSTIGSSNSSLVPFRATFSYFYSSLPFNFYFLLSETLCLSGVRNCSSSFCSALLDLVDTLDEPFV